MFTVCKYLWPFLPPWQDWEDSSFCLPLLSAASASAQLLSSRPAATADSPLGPQTSTGLAGCCCSPWALSPPVPQSLDIILILSPRGSISASSGLISPHCPAPSPGPSSLQLENAGCGEGTDPISTMLGSLLSSWHGEDLLFARLHMLGCFRLLPVH